MDVSSVHNAQEKEVFAAIREAAPHCPGLADDWELLADVA